MRRIALATLAAGIWINASEFLRNDLFFNPHVAREVCGSRLVFPSALINGALWGLWGFVIAGCIVVGSSLRGVVDYGRTLLDDGVCVDVDRRREPQCAAHSAPPDHRPLELG